MPKLFDRIVLDVIVVIATLMWTTYLIDNPVLALVVTAAVYLAVKTVYLFLFNRYKNLKTLPVGEMEFLFSAMTQDEQARHFLKTLPEKAVIFKENNYFCVSLDGARTIFFCCYKFTPVTNEDVAKAYRTAKDKNVRAVAFLGRTPPRQTMLLTRRLGLNARFIPPYKLKQYLIKHNAMPKKANFATVKNGKPERRPFRAVLAEAFHPRRAKYFAFTGVVLAGMSVFTPLKLYYLVLSSVALTIAAVSIFMKRFYQ